MARRYKQGDGVALQADRTHSAGVTWFDDCAANAGPKRRGRPYKHPLPGLDEALAGLSPVQRVEMRAAARGRGRELIGDPIHDRRDNLHLARHEMAKRRASTNPRLAPPRQVRLKLLATLLAPLARLSDANCAAKLLSKFEGASERTLRADIAEVRRGWKRPSRGGGGR